MDTVFVERIETASMRNGLVRVRCQATGADGQVYTSADLMIPANAYGQVVGALQNAGQQLREQLEQQRQQQSESETTS